MSAVYKWASGSHHKINPKLAGEELKRIEEKYGGIEAIEVVNESRDDEAVLHECFEWNNENAAELYRETQARELIRHITISYGQEENEELEPIEIRAFHSIVNDEEQRKYISTECIMSNDDYKEQLIGEAYKELQSFKKKYQDIKSLSKVFEAIESLKIAV